MHPTLLFYCQHSLGLGHLFRSLALCTELAKHFRIVLLCGGKLPATIRIPDTVHVVPLPPLGAAVDGRLISHDGRRSLDRARRLRREIILKTFRSMRPEVILIEFFPFGKKRFTGELVPLLDEARALGPNAPLIACSIRDILVSRGAHQQKHDDHASELANRYFDAVLIHSDPKFARFEDSFHPRVPLQAPIHYTGFVVSNGTSHNGAHKRGREILVSAGGGIVGEPLLRAAMAAHRLDPVRDVPMKVVAGPFLDEAKWRSLRAESRGRTGLTLRRSVPDLGAALHSASASVSQCGYNTALDILRAGVPALVVPFAEGEENEQEQRAHHLQRLGAVRVLESEALDPSTLAEEIGSLLRFRPRRVSLDLQGGAKSARILAELNERRSGRLELQRRR